ATIYQAFRSNGSPAIATHSKSGYCWTGSGTIDRNDAWRCLVANNILDPCFSSAHAKGVVLCPIAPWEKSEIEIHLTKPLAHNGGDNQSLRYTHSHGRSNSKADNAAAALTAPKVYGDSQFARASRGPSIRHPSAQPHSAIALP
ncbi:MAG: hypothetical protein ACRDK2_07415, partial [Solirubrobacteraceae bacterium]